MTKTTIVWSQAHTHASQQTFHVPTLGCRYMLRLWKDSHVRMATGHSTPQTSTAGRHGKHSFSKARTVSATPQPVLRHFRNSVRTPRRCRRVQRHLWPQRPASPQQPAIALTKLREAVQHQELLAHRGTKTPGPLPQTAVTALQRVHVCDSHRNHYGSLARAVSWQR